MNAKRFLVVAGVEAAICFVIPGSGVLASEAVGAPVAAVMVPAAVEAGAEVRDGKVATAMRIPPDEKTEQPATPAGPGVVAASANAGDMTGGEALAGHSRGGILMAPDARTDLIMLVGFGLIAWRLRRMQIT